MGEHVQRKSTLRSRRMEPAHSAFRVRTGGTRKQSVGVLTHEWRTEGHRYRMSSHASVGMPDGMKSALREAAERLTKLEGRRVSMSEVARRLLAAGGINAS